MLVNYPCLFLSCSISSGFDRTLLSRQTFNTNREGDFTEPCDVEEGTVDGISRGLVVILVVPVALINVIILKVIELAFITPYSLSPSLSYVLGSLPKLLYEYGEP